MYLKTGQGSNGLEEEFANFGARLQLRKRRAEEEKGEEFKKTYMWGLIPELSDEDLKTL